MPKFFSSCGTIMQFTGCFSNSDKLLPCIEFYGYKAVIEAATMTIEEEQEAVEIGYKNH